MGWAAEMGLLDPALLALEALYEVGYVAAEGGGDPAQSLQGRVAHPPLDRGQVGPVQSGIEGKAFLADAELGAPIRDATAEDDLPLGDALVGPGHPRI